MQYYTPWYKVPCSSTKYVNNVSMEQLGESKDRKLKKKRCLNKFRGWELAFLLFAKFVQKPLNNSNEFNFLEKSRKIKHI